MPDRHGRIAGSRVVNRLPSAVVAASNSSAQQYLKALSNLAVGTKASGGEQTARFVLNLK